MDGVYAYNRADDIMYSHVASLDYGSTLEIYGDEYQMYGKKNQ